MNETLTRSLSGLVYISILLFATLYSRDTFLLLFGGFLLITAYEFCKLIGLQKIVYPFIAVVLFCLYFMYTNTIQSLSDFVCLFSVLISVFLIFWLFSKKSFEFNALHKNLLFFGYIVFPFMLMTSIPILGSNYQPSKIIGIFILIWINDTFAYLVGKSIGKNKLFERISPKKTIEGFIGGLVFAMLSSFAIAIYLGEAVINWLVIALTAVIFGTIGDLVQSKFKRMANVKDSGNIMPGHGGILDRLDSIIFVSPFLFLFYKIIVYVS